jgi:2-hydroxy-3-keto-5-methylthiopentenyl-1-phosphate phosphatase
VRSKQITTVMSSWRRTFILDFDGTITTKDTISTLFDFALTAQASKGRDLTAARDEILAIYSEDFSRHVKDYSPAKEERNTIAQEVKYYQSLNGVENRSFERVSRSGLFRGISNNQWEVFGRDAVKRGQVVIRDGFGDFIREIETSGGIWGVVSVNFSSHFIRGVLAGAGMETSAAEVFANHSDEKGILLGPETGKVTSVMATSDAKLASMKALLNSWRSRTRRHVSKVVYIGDSGTDIECMTEEGTTGIIIAENRNSSLMEMMSRIGVDVQHVDVCQDGNESKVYWARDFREIVANSCLMSQQISQ